MESISLGTRQSKVESYRKKREAMNIKEQCCQLQMVDASLLFAK